MTAAMPILNIATMQHKFIKFRCFICLPFRTSHFSTVLYLDTFLDCHRVIFLAMSFITFCFQSKKALLCVVYNNFKEKMCCIQRKVLQSNSLKLLTQEAEEVVEVSASWTTSLLCAINVFSKLVKP